MIWEKLKDELAHWQDAGKRAEFWWRDDDAALPTGALGQLIEAAGQTPMNLAVIPGTATVDLVLRLWDHENVSISQHGWMHENHAPADVKKCEFGQGRDLADQKADIIQGYKKLEDMFGHRFLPVFVPPWNRIGTEAILALRPAGHRLLSTFTARSGKEAGIARLNTHVDIIDWHGSRGFAGTEAVLDQAVGHLKAKRQGTGADPTEPTGILSHHLVHDEDCTNFLKKFNHFIQEHPAAAWVGVETELDRLEKRR